MKTKENGLTKKSLLYFIGFPIIAAVLGYIFSGPIFIEPLYKADSVIFASAFQPTDMQKREGIAFGGDNEIAGTLQILNSNALIDSLANDFKDSTEDLEAWRKKMKARIIVGKTRYKSIEIAVLHPKPEVARELNQQIIKIADEIRTNMLKENRVNALDLARQKLHSSKEKLNAFLKNIDTLKNNNSKSTLKNEIEIERYLEYYEKEADAYYHAQNVFDNLKSELNTAGPKSYVVDRTHVSSSPYQPKRWLFAGVAFLLTLALLLIFYAAKK